LDYRPTCGHEVVDGKERSGTIGSDEKGFLVLLGRLLAVKGFSGLCIGVAAVASIPRVASVRCGGDDERKDDDQALTGSGE
jgi:hypothetical protein